MNQCWNHVPENRPTFKFLFQSLTAVKDRKNPNNLQGSRGLGIVLTYDVDDGDLVKQNSENIYTYNN